jgi:hypothetical protein
MEAAAPHLESLSDATDLIVLSARGAHLGQQIPAPLIARSVEAIRADPTGQRVSLVRDIWPQLEQDQHAQVLLAACGRNPKVDDLCASLDHGEALSQLAILSPGHDISAIVDCPDDGSRLNVLTELLSGLARAGASLEDAWLDATLRKVDEAGRLQVACASLESSGDGLAAATASLRIAHRAVGEAPKELFGTLQTFALGHLPETASTESAQLLDGLLAARLTRELKDVGKVLLGNEDRRSVGLAIRER